MNAADEVKTRTTVYISSDVIRQAKIAKINISAAAESGIRKAIEKAAYMEQQSTKYDSMYN